MNAPKPTRSAPLASFAALALLTAACSSNPTPAVTTHRAGTPYLSRTGTGDATLPSVTLPSSWSLVWHFACTDPVSRRPFVLTAGRASGTAVKVTDQAGLEGGGYRPFTSAGVYTFVVTTTCSWQVYVGTAGTQTIPSTTAP